ncbi:ankyrin repeat and lem domain-containing protein 1 [Holotrichia oblita]|uniref:Ankyrin repeat and lem domain-containing protein 1 n=1 Tax=Holotrichia oblita TaxID=644536 RepID=A0ACB9TMI4_HOLOL|nr:ankyrin repeat and lem domain-containing protein 1 [Holotrichia oblita]
MVGEYTNEADEEGADEKKEETKSEISQLNLNTLPHTDTQEYVLNWCNNQELVSNQTEFVDDCSGELNYCNNSAIIITKKETKCSSTKSSYQSERLSNSSISSALSNSKTDKKFNKVTIRNKNKHHINYPPQKKCNYKESSRESGILTLPESSDEDGGYSDDSFIDEQCEFNYIETTNNLGNLNIKEHKDTSSDYCTCTESSEIANILDKTIYGFSNNKNLHPPNSSNSDDQDLSFVSISEVYRYTDLDEGIVFYEKRILVTPSCSIQNETASTGHSQSSLPKSLDYDTDTLRKELTAQGFDPGPITKTTKRVYLRKLYQLKQQLHSLKPQRNDEKGKGKRSRPFQHLYEAVTNYNNAKFVTENTKINTILDIWKDNHGVICLHIFQNVIPAEAYTREAAMINALNLQNITNIKGGEFYGVSATWSQKQKNLLGMYLLYKAMKIFLNEGERQIFPNDLE